MTINEYWVEIKGDDYDFDYDEWSGPTTEHLVDLCFDTYDEAKAFVRNMKPEEALRLEKQAGTNGLAITIWEEEVLDGMYNDFSEAGSADWIGDKYNGDDFWDKED